MAKERLTHSEYVVICRFINPFLHGAEDHASRLKCLLKTSQPDMVQKQYDYYSHYCSALRHILEAAKQSAGVKPNVLTWDSGYAE